jgi:hypothetical protein
MEEIQEESDNFKTIQDAMSQPLQQIYNDSELLDELEQLELEAVEKEVSEIPGHSPAPVQHFPSVPTNKLTQEQEDEEELRQLRESVMNTL